MTHVTELRIQLTPDEQRAWDSAMRALGKFQAKRTPAQERSLANLKAGRVARVKASQ
jgi:hypothetical protein